MPSVSEVAVWEGIALLTGFLVVIAWKLLTDGINLDYLFYGDARSMENTGYSIFFSPGRAQMLVITVISAMYFLFQVIQDPSKFPDIPNGLIAVLGGSHAIYLSGKAQALYLGRLRDLAASLNRRRG